MLSFSRINSTMNNSSLDRFVYTFDLANAKEAEVKASRQKSKPKVM